MRKIFGFFSAGFLFYCFVLIATPVTMSSCEKEIIHDTITITDTVTITDTLTIIDSSCAACYDLKDGLVAWYNFNGSTLKDSSGNNNHIIFNNAVATTDRHGKPNNAYVFNGTSSYMKVNNSASLNPQGKISLMAIVKLNGFYTGPCHGNQIFKKGFSDQRDGIYGLRVSTIGHDCNAVTDTTKERPWAYYGNNQFNSVGAVDTTIAIRTGSWYNIIYTYDGTESKLYINGVLKITKPGSAPFTANTDAMFIGRAENPQFPYWLNGIIDEIRIYNRDLCEGEVKLLNKLPN